MRRSKKRLPDPVGLGWQVGNPHQGLTPAGAQEKGEEGRALWGHCEPQTSKRRRALFPDCDQIVSWTLVLCNDFHSGVSGSRALQMTSKPRCGAEIQPSEPVLGFRGGGYGWFSGAQLSNCSSVALGLHRPPPSRDALGVMACSLRFVGLRLRTGPRASLGFSHNDASVVI